MIIDFNVVILISTQENLDTVLPQAFLRGLSTASLAGRAQVVQDKLGNSCEPSEGDEDSCGDLIFYLDGAHTPESMEVCVRWFSNAVMDRSHVYNARQGRGLGKNHGSYCKGSNKISKQVRS